MNRYANLTPSKAIKDDFGSITLGFDRVQSEMDAKTDTDTSLQTQITAEQQARLAADTAHATALIAHAATQIALAAVSGMSATNLQAAIAELAVKIANIVASAGSGNTEIVDARLGADGTARSTLGTLVREIHAKLLAAAVQSVAVKYGWNYLLTDQASPLQCVIYGVSRVNWFGNTGKFELDSNSDGVADGWSASGGGTFTLDSTLATVGTKSQKIVADSGNNYVRQTLTFTSGSYYLLICDIYTSAPTDTYISYNGGTNTVFATKTAAWGTVYQRFIGPASATSIIINARNSATMYIDGARLYEIDAATYGKIGTDPEYTGDALAAKYPCVDGVKHNVNPAILLPGRNLLAAQPDTVHVNAVVTEPYKLTLTATAASQNSSFVIPALPGKAYTMSATHNGRIRLDTLDATGNDIALGTASAASTITKTTESNTAFIRVVLTCAAAGTFSFANWQLELGTAVSDFAPRNDDYLVVPIMLASNVDGSVRDTYNAQLNLVERRWRTDVALDGSFIWALNSDQTGYKKVQCTTFLAASGNGLPYLMQKHSGAISQNYNGGDGAQVGANNTFLYLALLDADTGWGEDYTPSAGEIAAYMMGWKMNNGTFGTPYNGSGTKTWTAINATSNTGAVTTVPTTPSTAITSGAADYYRLSYQLATPVVETVTVEGSLGLHPGGNQYELLSGAYLREPVIPYLHANGNRYINLDGTKVAGASASQLPRRAERILAVYKNNVRDPAWIIETTNGNAYGKGSAYLPASQSASFDPTAAYTVSSQALDRYGMTVNPVDVTGYYATNLKTVVDQSVQSLNDYATTLSIVQGLLQSTYLKGGGERIQTGSASGAIATAGTAVTVTVTYPIAYASAPKVQITPTSLPGTAGYANAVAENVTTTGFTLRLNCYAVGAMTINWEATGK